MFHVCLSLFKKKKTPPPNREGRLPPSSLPPDGAEGETYAYQDEPLHLVFNTKLVPPGYYVRLLAAILKQSECKLPNNMQSVGRYLMPFKYGVVDKIVVEEKCVTIKSL